MIQRLWLMVYAVQLFFFVFNKLILHNIRICDNGIFVTRLVGNKLLGFWLNFLSRYCCSFLYGNGNLFKRLIEVCIERQLYIKKLFDIKIVFNQQQGMSAQCKKSIM